MIYEEHGDYIKIFDKRNKSFIIDKEDFDLVKDYTWRVREEMGGTKRYVVSFTPIDYKTILLHRIVMGADDEQVVDHINGDETDNRRSNLRITNVQNNAKNRRLYRNNKSGVNGVYFYQGKWRARIQVNYKQISLGSFDTFEDAVDARFDAEEEYYGEFSRNTFHLAKDTIKL